MYIRIIYCMTLIAPVGKLIITLDQNKSLDCVQTMMPRFSTMNLTSKYWYTQNESYCFSGNILQTPLIQA